MASQLVDGEIATNRVSSTPRCRYGPICRTKTPRRSSSFARKSVVSRRPRPDTICPVESVRVPGGIRTSKVSARAPPARAKTSDRTKTRT